MKRLTIMGLIWVLSVVFITTGCPKDSKTALQDGFAASARAASYGTDFVKAWTQLRNDGAITKETFDGVINKMKTYGVAGRRINDALTVWVTKYPDGNVPPGEFSPLALAFNSDIYLPLLDIVAVVAGLSPANQAIVAIAVAGMRAAVFTIKRLFDKHSAILGLPAYPIDPREKLYATV